ncbi:nucleotide exchange factor GrpE [Rhizosphaericola mali]|uniref:Protein GrpE n=1 Tax=Rhizosphaericola mali TaxID=2545455 RepID=A0A5P2GEW2_9BACT|nr:nucleotide exchange factor GrpE [Rhizosphaericola mali]QES90141.1 nucleotide exchange factor GrpE [Rhizosphaericola mali]
MSHNNHNDHDNEDLNNHIPEENASQEEAFEPAESIINDDVVEKLKAEVAEQKDKYIRLMAEFENYKRRKAAEIQDINKTAGKDIIISMLEVLDDADRAEAQLTKDVPVDQLKEGIQLVFNKLRKNLSNKGLKELQSIHQEFDPELHEAITQIPAPTEDLQGKVLDQVKKGYYLNDKLIRHAQVVVGQ